MLGSTSQSTSPHKTCNSFMQVMRGHAGQYSKTEWRVLRIVVMCGWCGGPGRPVWPRITHTKPARVTRGLVDWVGELRELQELWELWELQKLWDLLELWELQEVQELEEVLPYIWPHKTRSTFRSQVGKVLRNYRSWEGYGSWGSYGNCGSYRSCRSYGSCGRYCQTYGLTKPDQHAEVKLVKYIHIVVDSIMIRELGELWELRELQVL